MMQRIGDSQYAKQAMTVARLLVITLTVVSAQLMFALPASAAGLQAQAQSQANEINNNQGVKFLITVPTQLLRLDSRIRYGMVECFLYPEKPESHPPSDRLGSGKTSFSINPSVGSFNGNVKVTVVPYKGVLDSQLAPKLICYCDLTLSQDGSNWLEPNDHNPPDMLTVASSVHMARESVAIIPASK
jgi:hypothetical protein